MNEERSDVSSSSVRTSVEYHTVLHQASIPKNLSGSLGIAANVRTGCEPTGLCANLGVTEASGKVSHARHEIVEVVTIWLFLTRNQASFTIL